MSSIDKDSKSSENTARPPLDLASNPTLVAMMPFFTCRRYQYAPLKTNARGNNQIYNRAFILKVFVIFTLILTTVIAGIFLSRAKSSELPKLPSYSTVFQHDPIFGAVPSNTSDEAWSRIFPEQGGFFKHPALAPQRSAFSVFHQLHCLNSIREGYYALLDAAAAGRQVNITRLPIMASPRHIAHCVDLIRQSLMCQPDLTIELKDETVGGVTGFGTRHVCKDWEALKAWMTEWETFDEGDKVENGKDSSVSSQN